MTIANPAVQTRTVSATLRDYISLLKLRIVALLDVTAVGVMLPAAHGHPRPAAVLAVLIGLTCAAGGANAINMWFDRDIDAEMTRTRRRPLPAGRIPPWHALVLGIGLSAVAFAVLWVGANLLAAALDLTGALIYVFVYTIWLKRSTPQNIVIGGAAGAMPPLVGWAAATGRLDLTALAFFGVVLFWTPPHFWALAAVLAFATTPYYAYALLASRPGSITALTDQQFGAGIMWVPGSITFSIVFLACLYLWFRQEDARGRAFGPPHAEAAK